MYPKEGQGNQTSEETRDILKSLISSRESEIKVNRLNKNRDGGVVIYVERDEDVGIIKGKIGKDL